MNVFVPFFMADPHYKEPISMLRGTFEPIRLEAADRKLKFGSSEDGHNAREGEDF